MRLSLKTKFTLTTSLVVLFVVALVSWLYVGRLANEVIKDINERATFAATQVLAASAQALADSAERGETLNSDSSADLREYVQHSLDNSSALNSLLESAIGYAPTIYEITITDQSGKGQVASVPKLRRRPIPGYPNASLLARASFLQQLRILYGPPRIY